jgi:hypothetical protein
MASGMPSPPKTKRIPMIVDLAFATNVRFLDEHELHLDDVQLYKVSMFSNHYPGNAKRGESALQLTSSFR